MISTPDRVPVHVQSEPVPCPPLRAANKPRPPKSGDIPLIRCDNLRPVGRGALLALIDVCIGPLKVLDCRLLCDGDKHPCVSGPQAIWTSDTGERRFKTLLEFPKAYRQAVVASVWSAWETHTNGGNNAP